MPLFDNTLQIEIQSQSLDSQSSYPTNSTSLSLRGISEYNPLPCHILSKPFDKDMIKHCFEIFSYAIIFQTLR